MLTLVAAHNFHFLQVWQEREGVQLNDMLLNQLPPVDLSLWIFLLEYSTLLLVFVFILPYPDRFIRGIQMFTMATFLRTICIYFVALEPPKDMIHLIDPCANFFLHSNGVFVTKDLFFPGHIAAITLMMLVSTNRYVKTWALLATIVISIMLLTQHVHYTFDVLFAPVAAFICYKVVLFAHSQIGQKTFEFQSQKN
ncbi:MAG: hypothetical protein IPP77_08760 [Bacteroidetes bacterium]|nr:hypothetical protein [Bacteroidota bacterium]